MPRLSNWTASQVDALKALWGTRPAIEIAKELGATKNAVIGKANRLGLSAPKGSIVTPNLNKD